MSAKIEKLNKKQEAKIPEYVDEYLKIGLSTTPCDRKKAEAAITDSYLYQKLVPPTFIWLDSPEQGAIMAAKLAKMEEGDSELPEVTTEEIRAQAGMASYGSFDAYWVSFYAFIVEQLPVKADGLLGIVKSIVQNCGVYWTFEDVVVITEKPSAIHMVDGKLHNDNGLALEYKDGTGVFALYGVNYQSLLDATIKQAAKK